MSFSILIWRLLAARRDGGMFLGIWSIRYPKREFHTAFFAIWIAPWAQVQHRSPPCARSQSASFGPLKAMTRERTFE
jgi:hypothetical protein